jgi:hypothetical protein
MRAAPLMLAVLALCLVPRQSAAQFGIGGGSAAGRVTFFNAGLRAQATFNVVGARANLPARGDFYYQEIAPNGYVRFFRMRVTQVIAGSGQALFVGRVTFTNNQVWRDKVPVVRVLDFASPGSGGDLVAIHFLAVEPRPLSLAATSTRPRVFLPVQTGDLRVLP